MKQIIIDQPCKVSWKGMKKVDGGRFCDVCCHEVRDYSHKTAAEISAMSEELSTQKFCARFNREHVVVLNNDTTILPSGRILAAMLLAILMFFGCKTKKKTVYSSPRFQSLNDDPQKIEHVQNNKFA